MKKEENRKTLGFQAEVKQLLHLMIHSLYSNKEIFLRELISNASDAVDRLRFEAISDADLYEGQPDLEIRVEYDPDQRSVTVTDTGIGMSMDEVVEQLGTIARSGTAEFLRHLTGDERQDSALIGQFGVGFYSSFIVAERVELYTRRAGLPAADGVRWESDGEGEFTVEPATLEPRGTSVVLHLREENSEFTDAHRLRALIRKYSDHIGFPIRMPIETAPAESESDAAAAADAPGYETVNAATALWNRARSDISDDEYREFYKHISHDFAEPLAWSHNKVEGKREYTSLLFVPGRAPFDLWNREAPRGLKLYVQRVFIMDDAAQFLPLYLRFIRGIVDSNDLSLNVSREILQQDANVDAIRGALTKRALGMLEKLAADEPEKYQTVWNEFGRVLKEGPAEDSANRDRIARLMRFATTSSGETQDQPLADIVARQKEGQDKIWYVVSDSYAGAKSSPQLEVFRDQGVEVLLLSDPIDEWVVGHVGEFEGKAFRDVARGELDLDALPDKGADDEDVAKEQHEALIGRLKTELGDDVEDVRVTRRLTESPACLAVGEYAMGNQMRKLMEASGQQVPPDRPIFEVNPDHPLILRLAGEEDETIFADLARVLLDEAGLAEGRQPGDPGEFIRRLNRLLVAEAD